MVSGSRRLRFSDSHPRVTHVYPGSCEPYHTLAPIQPHSYILSLSTPSGSGLFKLISLFYSMSAIAPKTSPSGPVVSLENLLFDYPEADIILRSSDSYEFRVIKTYIFHSSPVLCDRQPPPIPSQVPPSPLTHSPHFRSSSSPIAEKSFSAFSPTFSRYNPSFLRPSNIQ